MIDCYTQTSEAGIPLVPLTSEEFKAWLSEQAPPTQRWLVTQNFTAKAGEIALLPQPDGALAQVLFGVTDEHDAWALAKVAARVPQGVYTLEVDYTAAQWEFSALAWGLAHYPSFSKGKVETMEARQLSLPAEVSGEALSELVDTIAWVRDLITQPPNLLKVEALADEAKQLAKTHGARYKQIVGDSLLRHHFPLVHAVGRGSDQVPRLIELNWGRSEHPTIVLVGKGVCFDTGGLDLKTPRGMRFMKKDMGGAAHVLGLARLIMAHKLPLNLRVLIPMVENSLGAKAYRPSDVLPSRKGLSVEIGNTDAEGRLILADALAYAAEDPPALMIDFATLTGAARAALGTELPALFTNEDSVAAGILDHACVTNDPLWRMPLFQAYKSQLKSTVADINNCSDSPYGGAITAALFLQAFVPSDIPWVHIDLMAWNQTSKPGRPEGGEAMGLRALWSYLQDYAKNNS